MLVSSDLSGELSYLDVVRCRDLTPLTAANPLRTERLAAGLVQGRVLRHPLVTTQIAGKRVVLDGHARLAAAIQIGLPDVLVQDIPFEAVPDPLRLPAFAATGVSEKEVRDAVAGLLHPADKADAGALSVILRNLGSVEATADPAAPERLWQVFTGVVTSLRGLADLIPLVRGSGPGKDPREWPSDAAAVIVPPPLPLNTVARLVELGIRLPWGVLNPPATRRILGINLSLDILSAPEPTAEKAAFVRELIRLRLSERRVHYYDAPVVIFEE